MFDDLKVTYINLRSIRSIYGYVLISILILVTFVLGLQLEDVSFFEKCISLTYIALVLINVVSLFYGIYCSMLLIPPQVSWLAKMTMMLALISLYTLATYTLDLWSIKYRQPYHFNFLETLIVGLTGLSVIEDIYFIGISTHLFMLTLTLPWHATLTLLSFLFIFTLSGIFINLYFNSSANEAFSKSDFATFSLFVFDALVKTMALFTIISCTWFNVTILPIHNVYIATTVSVILTSIFSYAYYFLDKTFSLINYRAGQYKVYEDNLHTGSNQLNRETSIAVKNNDNNTPSEYLTNKKAAQYT